MHKGLASADLHAIREHVNTGRVLGSARFQQEIATMLKRRVSLRPPGRPRKQETADEH